MRDFFIAVAVLAIFFASISNAENLPENTNEQVVTMLKNSEFGRLAVQNGVNIEFVGSYETNSEDWTVVKFFFSGTGDILKQPMVFFYNSRYNILAAGLIIENGRLVKPLSPIVANPEFKTVPQEVVKDLKTENRKIYNPDGARTLYFFYDPECEFCRDIVERLPAYTGVYRVVRKWRPLVELHPSAKEKAVMIQTEELKKKGYPEDQAAEIARRIVDEDLADAKRIGVFATPIFISDEGRVYPNVPDL